MLEYITLGMVLEQPLTGYDIKKFIETGIGTFYKASYGSLYPLLKRMTDQGLLTVIEESQGNRHKKYYKITDQGTSAFFQWLKSPIEFNGSTDQQLARIYFFDKLPRSERERVLAEYEKSCMAYLDELKGLLEKYDGMEHKDCFYFKLSTLYYGIAAMETTVRWCRQVKEQGALCDLISGEKG